jgi:hypothetical protein
VDLPRSVRENARDAPVTRGASAALSFELASWRFQRGVGRPEQTQGWVAVCHGRCSALTSRPSSTPPCACVLKDTYADTADHARAHLRLYAMPRAMAPSGPSMSGTVRIRAAAPLALCASRQ